MSGEADYLFSTAQFKYDQVLFPGMRIRPSDRDRFDRMRRVEWMDMESVQLRRCLMVGAGALGNEVLKCLVLSGFRDITVVDMDEIVPSNLSRCLFFREEDVGRAPKAQVLAERASSLDSAVTIRPVVSRIQDAEDWDFDIVLGCLDNISARLHVNSHARYHGAPYVDGATDGLSGKVHTVLRDGPCLQCAMNRSHMKVLERRYTCTGREATLYSRPLAAEITTTSVVAAMEVREALKIASGREDLCVREVMYYDGMSGSIEKVELDVDPGCPNHGDREAIA